MTDNTENENYDPKTALLADLAKWKGKAREAEAKLEAVTAEAAKWKTRWHADAVENPFTESLTEIAAIPVKYFKDILKDWEVLRYIPDEEGIERPTLCDRDGYPVAFKDKREQMKFFRDLADSKTFEHAGDMARFTRAPGGSGMGSTDAGNSVASPEQKKPSEPSRPQLGIK